MCENFVSDVLRNLFFIIIFIVVLGNMLNLYYNRGIGDIFYWVLKGRCVFLYYIEFFLFIFFNVFRSC